MSKLITREYLESKGITVTEDGRVFRNGKEKNQFAMKAIHNLGKDKSYPAIGIYDAELYKERGQMTNILLVSRVVWAWFHGVCPSDLDIDHIDNDSWNNHLSNLQILDRAANNRRKPRQGNQFLVNLNDEEYFKYKATKAKLFEDIKMYRANMKACSMALKTLKEDYREDLAKCVHKSQVELLEDNFERQEADLKEKLFIYKKKWHEAVQTYKQFIKENRLGE